MNLQISQDEAAAFLYNEARLLDEGRLEQWLELFAPDSLYWLPISDVDRAERDTSLIYDGDIRRRERVYRLTSTPLPSQNPPSRTAHLISNITVDKADTGADRVRVRSVQVVFELRTGDHTQRGLGTQHFFVGHCTHELVRIEGQWCIALKKLVLLNRDVAVPNLTFML